MMIGGDNLGAQAIKKDYLRDGNKEYKKARYPIADSLYAMAVMNDTSYATGYYNRGNALYLGGDAASAHGQWMKALMNTPGEEEKADILYNLGALQMDAQNYGEAIKLYKDALRRNPSDEEARYNLALAKELLKDQQQNQDQNNQNNQNQDNKDQNKDQNNQNDQNQDNKDQNKDQNNQNDQNQDNKDQNKDQNNQNDQNQDNKDQNKDQKNQNNQNQDNKDQNKNQNNSDEGQNPQCNSRKRKRNTGKSQGRESAGSWQKIHQRLVTLYFKNL